MKRICVYCGSSPGAREEYREGAVALGRALLDQGLGLVYGGASVGLMGVVANTVLEGGGEVIGIIPENLMRREVALTRLDDLRVVGTMHERKALMAELSDGFIALPGGLGTFEELFETLTWAQLGIHAKPCGVLDVNGYYASLVSFLAHACAEGFMRQDHLQMLYREETPEALLERFRHHQPPAMKQWLDLEET